MKAENVERLRRFIWERQNIYKLKESGMPRPWTEDKILQKYRFCNVYREQDKVTKWIAKNVRKPYQNDPDLWFAMAICRLINFPGTLAELGNLLPWNPRYFLQTIASRKKAGLQIYNVAYIVSTNGVAQEKSQYLAEVVLGPAWKSRECIRPQYMNEPLVDIHARLMEFHGFGSFIAGQIIADIKYAPQHRKAPDWWTFAASGPGSRRGLNRICGYGLSDAWKEGVWHAELMKLLSDIVLFVEKSHMPPLHAQDLQNCLCEFDKFERVRLGQGRPKSTYPGVAK